MQYLPDSPIFKVVCVAGGLSTTGAAKLEGSFSSPFWRPTWFPSKSSQQHIFTMRYTISNVPSFRAFFAGGALSVADAATPEAS